MILLDNVSQSLVNILEQFFSFVDIVGKYQSEAVHILYVEITQ
jgi:hypothetical protein